MVVIQRADESPFPWTKRIGGGVAPPGRCGVDPPPGPQATALNRIPRVAIVRRRLVNARGQCSHSPHSARGLGDPAGYDLRLVPTLEPINKAPITPAIATGHQGNPGCWGGPEALGSKLGVGLGVGDGDGTTAAGAA